MTSGWGTGRVVAQVVGVALAVCVIAAGVYAVAAAGQGRTYCALMPDSVGLYRDSAVTMRGIVVGSVTDIAHDGGRVRVEFEVHDDHRPVGEVSATTVSSGIVADRELAVLSGSGGAEWDPEVCIERTLTPQSLSRTLDGIAHLSDQIVAHDGPGLGRALSGLDEATAGVSGEMNAVIHTLASALESPEEDIARTGRIIEALASLAESANRGWADVESMFTRFPETFGILDHELFPMVVELGDALAKLLPMLNELSVFSGAALATDLDLAVPFLEWAAANVGGLREVMDLIPVIASGFTGVTDPETGGVKVSYAPPTVGLSGVEADLMCEHLNGFDPGLCRASGDLARVDMTRLVLGAVTR